MLQITTSDYISKIGLKTRNLGDTEVIAGSNMTDQLVPYLSHRFAEGALCVIYDRGVTSIAQDIIAEFKSAGYRVFVQAVSSTRERKEEQTQSVPEYVRHVFAVGAGTAAKYAKEKAMQLGIEWTLFFTAPSTDTIMHTYAPKTVFIDEDVLKNSPPSCIAAGYGIIFSQPLSSFENMFSKKVLAEDATEPPQTPWGNMSVTDLAFTLLEISYSGVTDSAQTIAEVLYAMAVKKGKRPRLIGEYKFLSSALITAFYAAFLAAPSIDTMPPACFSDAMDELKFLNIGRNSLKSVDFFQSNSYFRISYILSEYRTDLLDKLGSIDFHTAQRFWRRLYPDAGYWLKGEITCKDLMKGLVLAAADSDNLLGFAYASGVMSAF